MVVPRGNAPRSFAYQARALLLSYRTKCCDWPSSSNARKVRTSSRNPHWPACCVGNVLDSLSGLLYEALCPSYSNGTIWFVALTSEQLAAITQDWFHGCSFQLLLRRPSLSRKPAELMSRGPI